MQSWLAQSWYSLNYSVMMTLYTVGLSLRFEGSRHVPPSGPVLLIANHQSFLDPVAVGLAVTSRQLCFLARKTLFANRYFGGYLSSVGVYPVDQGGIAKEGLQKVIELLELGRCVLVFPEGERSHTGKMQPLRPGISLLLRKSRPTVVPVGIAGAFEAFPRTARLPVPAPLFPPTQRPGLAVSLGKPFAPDAFANRSREDILAILSKAIDAAQQRAEALRLRR
jgi:1-acyl-sn-glycerol-3-phosphate acyltransferase